MDDQQLLNQMLMRDVIWNTLKESNYIFLNRHLIRAMGLKSVKNIERKKVKRMPYVKAQKIEKVCIE